MAESRGVWGIDIGQAALKAVRLRYADAAEQAIAVAFDYVPHPKILSQPDAVPEELIPQALEKFLSRNDVEGDAVAISVPGQTALARFIQLPPVESSKVAEIVKYEARQQIPFALEDVIWDYQTLGGGVEESGYMLEAEVGLFAMKRDQVMQQLQPFLDHKVEIELIQIAPLALYNVLSYDQLGIRPQSDLESADEYQIMLDMGADNTTLLVSNGEKIWIRNVPIGGNHFTRSLTKEMKLTFAKAEHLKCNATKSPDPRAVFQALRPVFNDYVSEIQRSIGYFSSVNRDAKITKILGLGNGFKLAGLQKFLQQNLQYDVERLENYQGLVGDAVLNAPLFQENALSFAVPYGLALQALDLTRIRTTLLPPEIRVARQIRRKKPWAVATAATLLLGFSLSAAGYAKVWNSVSPSRWDEPIKKGTTLKTEAGEYVTKFNGAKDQFNGIRGKGDKLIQNLDARDEWLEIYKAINDCLPRDTGPDPELLDITLRHRLKVTSITAKREADLKTWFDNLRTSMKDEMIDYDVKNPPSGPGYVFTLEGFSYHHNPENRREEVGMLYVRHTLLKNLQSWMVRHEGKAPVPVGMIGISHATSLYDAPRVNIDYHPGGLKAMRAGGRNGRKFGGGFPDNPAFPEAAVPAADPAGGVRGAKRPKLEDDEPKIKKIPQTRFTLQFAWRSIAKAKRKPQSPWAPAGGKPAAQPPPAATPPVDNQQAAPLTEPE